MKENIAINPNSNKVNLQPSKSFYFYFQPELQFNPVPNQIVYVETTYNEPINQFILLHLTEIDNFFAEKGFSFFYLPRLVEQLKDKDFLQYNFPAKAPHQELAILSSADYSFLQQYVVSEQSLQHGLIRYKRFEQPKPTFSYFELNENDIWAQLEHYRNNLGEGMFFSLGSPKSADDRADFNFDRESQQLMEEIKERVARLRVAGVGEVFIRELLEEPPVLSHLVITSDYRFLLPEFNLEVELAPLPKALYLLFLRHPEGIILKHLPDYRKELLKIYTTLNPRVHSKEAASSIRDLTDPTRNSINEKCSRIREAFVKLMNERIAKAYCITGNRGEPKKIQLDRKWVVFE
jgi:hypothetical protein